MHINKKPLISIILPIYNAEKTLRQCLDSILTQLYSNFELIIVNDGSTDNSLSIASEYKNRDNRISIYTTANQGIAKALNLALSFTKGEYIFRMDGDDVMDNRKLLLQTVVLNNFPSIDIISSWYTKFTTANNNANVLVKLPVSNCDIKTNLIMGCPICHPSVAIRKSIKSSVVYSDRSKAEDHRLWCSLIDYKMYNIPYPLLKYRISNQSLTSKNRFANRVDQALQSIRLLTNKNYVAILRNNRRILWRSLSKSKRLGLNLIVSYLLAISSLIIHKNRIIDL